MHHGDVVDDFRLLALDRADRPTAYLSFVQALASVHRVDHEAIGLSTFGLVAGLLLLDPLTSLLSVDRELVLLGVVGLWVSMNYDVVTAVYRIEQRPQAYVAYSLLNIAVTVALSLLFVVVLDLGGAGIMLIVSVAGALWAASGYVSAFTDAANTIYEVEEGRPFWKLKPFQLLVTLLLIWWWVLTA